ncbi:hypothetical protein [Paenibacillus terrigena]|nr:hypothetical protein [Paenibacillus terrigena]
MNEEVGFLAWLHYDVNDKKMDPKGCYSGIDVSRPKRFRICVILPNVFH